MRTERLVATSIHTTGSLDHQINAFERSDDDMILKEIDQIASGFEFMTDDMALFDLLDDSKMFLESSNGSSKFNFVTIEAATDLPTRKRKILSPCRGKKTKKCTYETRRNQLAALQQEALALETTLSDLQTKKSKVNHIYREKEALAQSEQVNRNLKTALTQREAQIQHLLDSLTNPLANSSTCSTNPLELTAEVCLSFNNYI